MNIHELRNKIGQEIVDYNQLKDVLKKYAHPRGKISEWLAKGELIRVKKGLYVFGKPVARQPFSTEVLANLIYGPSAISKNYALSYYGLIPERAHTVTSITNKRNKEFKTPIGQFAYQYLSNEKYAIGIQLLTTKSGLNFLIATPEKAISDLIIFSEKTVFFNSTQDVQQFLIEDLRIDEENLKKLNMHLLSEITNRYSNATLNQFFSYFKEMNKTP
jgi:predicted transcriptional regulator of viral defense system